jgi:hypothetical protein
MTAPGTMTLAELQALIAESQGEWEQIEFKKSTGQLHGGMETLCGFLNGSGGKVLFGVTNLGMVRTLPMPRSRKWRMPSVNWNRPPGSNSFACR